VGRPTKEDPIMPTFLFTYRNHKAYIPGSPETVSSETAAAWRDFFEGMESNLEDMGKPVFTRTTVGECDESTVLGGYSLVSAESIEEALALAERCPILEHDGGVEVGELTPLDPDSLAASLADHPSARSTA
jgi:hypothetical protein